MLCNIPLLSKLCIFFFFSFLKSLCTKSLNCIHADIIVSVLPNVPEGEKTTGKYTIQKSSRISRIYPCEITVLTCFDGESHNVLVIFFSIKSCFSNNSKTHCLLTFASTNETV